MTDAPGIEVKMGSDWKVVSCRPPIERDGKVLQGGEIVLKVPYAVAEYFVKLDSDVVIGVRNGPITLVDERHLYRGVVLKGIATSGVGDGLMTSRVVFHITSIKAHGLYVQLHPSTEHDDDSVQVGSGLPEDHR